MNWPAKCAAPGCSRRPCVSREDLNDGAPVCVYHAAADCSARPEVRDGWNGRELPPGDARIDLNHPAAFRAGVPGARDFNADMGRLVTDYFRRKLRLARA